MAFKLASIVTVIILFMTLPAQARISAGDDTVWTKNIGYPNEVKYAHFSPDGSKVFLSTKQGITYIYNTLTGNSISSIKGVGGFWFYSPDKKFIYTDAFLKIDASTFEVLAKPDYIPKDFDAIGTMAITGDGRYLLETTTWLNNILNHHDSLAVYDASNYKFVTMISDTEKFIGIATSPDGKYFVTNTYWADNWQIPKNEHNSLVLWDAKTLKRIKVISPSIGSVRFTPDSKYLVGLLGNKIIFFETVNFTVEKEINNLGGESYICSNDSKYIVDGSPSHNIVEIWDINQSKLVYRYNIYYGGYALDISPDNKYIFAANGWYFTLYNFKTSPDFVSDNTDYKVINITPNPISGSANLNLTIQKPGNYQISISNINGNFINNIFDGFLNSGEQHIEFDAKPYSNGTYFCHLLGNGFNINYKLIIAK